MATLKDIAEQSGITISSVSDILNNRPGSRYSEETRAKVKKAALDLGYQRNRLVQGMIRGRSQLIGIILPDLNNPFYSNFLQSASPILRDADYNLLIEETRVDASPETEKKAIQTLSEFRVDGILACFIHAQAHRATLTKLSQRGIAVSGIGLEIPGKPLAADTVGIRFGDGLKDACQHLVKQGRSRFAFLGNFPWDAKLGYRWELLTQSLSDLGLPGQPFASIPCEHSMAGAAKAFAEFLASTPRKQWPDALFALNDNLAIGCCRAAADAGLRIPDDLAIVGFDNTPLGSFQVPALTSIGVDLPLLGTTAAQFLVERLRQPGSPFRSETFSADLILRETA